MKNRGVVIHYDGVAPEAKENFVASTTESEFDTLYQLQEYNLDFPNYANPCELYQTILDGAATAFPPNPEGTNLGFWSKQTTDNNGEFAEPIVLTLTSDEQYSSQGLTLTFDTYNNIFATRIKIKWLRVSESAEVELSEKDFTPNSTFYFCQNKVENYNKVIITFYALNMPQNRLKLRVIDYGYATTFYSDELKNVRLIQEIDPISAQISISTADFVLNLKENTEYQFQLKQPLKTYFNGKLRATTFIKSVKRKSKTVWNIQSEDYIGLMDSVPFCGGIYNGKIAYDLIEEIFVVAKVPHTINPALKGVLVYGYIPFTSCRVALMQVAFAVQNVVGTSNSDTVSVYELAENVKHTIPLDRIMQGQSFADDETVTAVEVVSHSYAPITDTVKAYSAEECGAGQNIFVKFSEPLHDLSISSGTIIEGGTNYAIINANSDCVLSGQKYTHLEQVNRKNNPLVLANEMEKVVSIENATLVSSNNVDNVLEKCYNWLVNKTTVNSGIVESKKDTPVNVGEVINVETKYLDNAVGRVIKQTFNLNGGIIVKKTVMKGYYEKTYNTGTYI